MRSGAYNSCHRYRLWLSREPRVVIGRGIARDSACIISSILGGCIARMSVCIVVVMMMVVLVVMMVRVMRVTSACGQPSHTS